MAYTNDDLAAVKQAIIDLATGKRRVTVSFSTTAGSSSVSYGQADIATLRALRDEIQKELNVGQRRQVRLASRGSGFR